MGIIYKFTDPRLWRNVPQCVVDCCLSLLERIGYLEKKSHDFEVSLVEADRKVKTAISTVNATQKCDLGELRSLLEAKMSEQVNQITARCTELAEVDSKIENNIRKQQIQLKEIKVKQDVLK